MSKTWTKKTGWVETPTSPELKEFAERYTEPDPNDTSIRPGGWSNPDNTVPSDFGKLRKMYGERMAEIIEIEDDIAHSGDY